MIWRTVFVAVLLTVLAVACSDRYRGICDTTTTIARTKNKALGITGSTLYGEYRIEARSCP